MACDCLEKTKEKILEKVSEIHPEYTIIESDFQNLVYPFTNDSGLGNIILTHRFEYTYTFPKVSGDASKPRRADISINPTYCGFCGKKFVEDPPADGEAKS